MEECESLDTEMTDLQEFECGPSDSISQDDEDEVEELHNRCLIRLSGSYKLNNQTYEGLILV